MTSHAAGGNIDPRKRASRKTTTTETDANARSKAHEAKADAIGRKRHPGATDCKGSEEAGGKREPRQPRITTSMRSKAKEK